MIRRLFVLALLLVAAASVSTPAHAAPYVNIDCANYGYATMGCAVMYNNSTAIAVSPWTVSRPGYSYTVPYDGTDLIFNCTVGTNYTVSLTVTDSSGATTASGARQCRAIAD